MINHRFSPLKSRRNTQIYGAVKLQNFSVSKHGRHSVSSNCDNYIIPHGRETKPYFSGITIPEYFPTHFDCERNCFRGKNKHVHSNEWHI